MNSGTPLSPLSSSSPRREIAVTFNPDMTDHVDNAASRVTGVANAAGSPLSSSLPPKDKVPMSSSLASIPEVEGPAILTEQRKDGAPALQMVARGEPAALCMSAREDLLPIGYIQLDNGDYWEIQFFGANGSTARFNTKEEWTAFVKNTRLTEEFQRMFDAAVQVSKKGEHDLQTLTIDLIKQEASYTDRKDQSLNINLGADYFNAVKNRIAFLGTTVAHYNADHNYFRNAPAVQNGNANGANPSSSPAAANAVAPPQDREPPVNGRTYGSSNQYDLLMDDLLNEWETQQLRSRPTEQAQISQEKSEMRTRLQNSHIANYYCTVAAMEAFTRLSNNQLNTRENLDESLHTAFFKYLSIQNARILANKDIHQAGFLAPNDIHDTAIGKQLFQNVHIVGEAIPLIQSQVTPNPEYKTIIDELANRRDDTHPNIGGILLIGSSSYTLMINRNDNGTDSYTLYDSHAYHRTTNSFVQTFATQQELLDLLNRLHQIEDFAERESTQNIAEIIQQEMMPAPASSSHNSLSHGDAASASAAGSAVAAPPQGL
jgi:hypothetical protein